MGNPELVRPVAKRKLLPARAPPIEPRRSRSASRKIPFRSAQACLSLQSVKGEIVQHDHGFAFAMRVPGSSRTVRVIVANEALTIKDRTAANEELQAELAQRASYCERVANERCDLGRVAAGGVTLIAAGDLVGPLA